MFPNIKVSEEMEKLIQKYGNLWFIDTLSKKDKQSFLTYLGFDKEPEQFKNTECDKYQYTLLQEMKRLDYCEDKTNI